MVLLSPLRRVVGDVLFALVYHVFYLGAQKVVEKLASKRESIKSLVQCDSLILFSFSMVTRTSFQIDYVK
jgi:hypothetical protein